MKRLTTALAAVTALTWCGFASADVPPPVVKKAANLSIEVDDKAKGVKVLIPANALRERRGAPGAPGGLGAADEFRWPTAVAGCALALSLGCGGVWLARRGKSGKAAAAGVLAGVLALGAGSLAVADIAPPDRPKPPPALYETEVNVEAFTQDAKIRIVLSKAALKELLDKAAKAKGE